ncbi:L-arabinose ABC transporter membrane protein [Chromohalobacter marismortui]|uniref:L-arabinose ABC transporter membrane protein n=2 Tax=Chromohalobacter TaxID=42054 RepID=A0A4R7NRZ2_9GAMM|nr:MULTISPECIES: L-arabinose ABC transporter permease AraH [Chromohalobacter]MCI0511385.1 L-arabinose ABC transporter permease AraH [Chromohalobacter sp.]TDU23598.1 L-arabinose ABC transporter membrane protein [Chromohalobacter marismortui]
MSTDKLAASDTSPAAPKPRVKALRTLLDTSGLIAIFFVLFIALSIFVPDFLTGRNIVGLLLSVTLIGTIATTMMMVLALGEVDLSVASIVAFAGVVAAVVTSTSGSVFIGVLVGVGAGGAVGAFNGFVVSKFGINSLIATLAAMEFVRGLAYITSGGDAVMVTVPGFFDLGSASFLGLTLPVWTMIACFVVFGIVLNMTAFGRNTLATGGNAEAASLAGVNVRRLKITVFALQGVVAGIAGVLLASRMGLGDPNTSMGLELAVISACVLGGVSLSGGVASITGVLVGVLIMGCVQNAMGLLNVPTFYQYLVRGAILLLAVMFDRWKQARRAKG